MRSLLSFLLSITLLGNANAQTVKILFDATKAETAGNADWVVDADVFNVGFGTGPAVIGGGNEANAQRYPTPAATPGQTYVENYWKGALSYWGLDCIQKGYGVETLPIGGSITFGNAANPQDLSNYTVFVVCEPNIQFTAAEKTAILAFVQNGGGLFMVSDHDVSDRNNDGWDSPRIWDDLMQVNSTGNTNPFGLNFNRSVSTSIDNFSETSTNYNQALTANDPILHGTWGNVAMIKWSNGTSMTLDPVANPSVKAVFYQTAVGTPPTGNNQVMVAYARYGNGKVVAIGDSSPCDDGTGDTNDNLFPGYMGDVTPNHRNLMMNGTIWLATSSSPAPVTLTSFDATAGTRDVNLKWTAENQVNIREYNIERSIDGRHFDLVGRVQATPNNPNSVNYHFTDLSVPVNVVLYYRLKIFENSGMYNYSQIKALSIQDQKTNISILQDRMHHTTNISIDLPDRQRIQISLLTTDGKLLFARTVDHNPGLQIVPLALENYAHSIYIIKVVSIQNSTTLQFMHY